MMAVLDPRGTYSALTTLERKLSLGLLPQELHQADQQQLPVVDYGRIHMD